MLKLLLALSSGADLEMLYSLWGRGLDTSTEDLDPEHILLLPNCVIWDKYFHLLRTPDL